MAMTTNPHLHFTRSVPDTSVFPPTPTLRSHLNFSELKKLRVSLKTACDVRIRVTLGVERDEAILGLHNTVAKAASVNDSAYSLEIG